MVLMRTNQKLRVSTINKIMERVQTLITNENLKNFTNTSVTDEILAECEFKLEGFDFTTSEFCITCTMADNLFLKYDLALITAQSKVRNDYASVHSYFRYDLPAGFLDLYNLIMRCMFNHFDVMYGIRINFRSNNDSTMHMFRYGGIELGYYDNDDSTPSDITGLGLNRPYECIRRSDLYDTNGKT